MPTIEKTITIKAYTTPDTNVPTCAVDIWDGSVCKWLHRREYGLIEVCGITL